MGKELRRIPRTLKNRKKKWIGTWCSNDGAPFLVGLDTTVEQDIKQRISKLSSAGWQPPAALGYSINNRLKESIEYYNSQEHLLTSAIALDRTLRHTAETVDDQNLDLNSTVPRNRAFSAVARTLKLIFISFTHSVKKISGLLDSLFNTISILTVATLLLAILTENIFVSIVFVIVAVILFLLLYGVPDIIRMFNILKAINMDRAFEGMVDRTRTPFDRKISGRESYVSKRAATSDIDAALARARVLTLGLDLNLALDLDRAFDRSMDLPKARAFARATTLSHILNYSPASALGDFAAAIDREDFATATEILENSKGDQSSLSPRLKVLICAVLAVVNARTRVEVQTAERRYMARILEYMQIGYEGIYGDDSGTRLKRWLRPRRGIKELRRQQETALRLYWWLQIVLARSDAKGKEDFPTWDGIRIVREQGHI